MDQGIAAIITAVIAVVGSVITLILARYLKTAGKIVVKHTNSDWQLVKRGNNGRSKKVFWLKEAQAMNVTMEVDIYNSSGDTKVVEVVYIEARTRFNQIKTVLLDDIPPVKLGPKQLENVSFSFSFEPHEMEAFKTHKRVYFYLILWSYEGKKIRRYFYAITFHN